MQDENILGLVDGDVMVEPRGELLADLRHSLDLVPFQAVCVPEPDTRLRNGCPRVIATAMDDYKSAAGTRSMPLPWLGHVGLPRGNLLQWNRWIARIIDF